MFTRGLLLIIFREISYYLMNLYKIVFLFCLSVLHEFLSILCQKQVRAVDEFGKAAG